MDELEERYQISFILSRISVILKENEYDDFDKR